MFCRHVSAQDEGVFTRIGVVGLSASTLDKSQGAVQPQGGGIAHANLQYGPRDAVFSGGMQHTPQKLFSKASLPQIGMDGNIVYFQLFRADDQGDEGGKPAAGVA